MKYSLGAKLLIPAYGLLQLVTVTGRTEFAKNSDGTPTRENQYNVAGEVVNEAGDTVALQDVVTESVFDLHNAAQANPEPAEVAADPKPESTDAGQAADTE
jgi:hypothetical protein